MAIPETHVMEYDNLFASQVMPVVSDVLTIPQGGILKRGSVLTVSGTLVGAAETSADEGADDAQGGTETQTASGDEVYAVLAEDVDTTEGEVGAAVYLTGEFNSSALIFKEGTTAEDMKVSARKVGIFFKKAI